MSLTPDVRRIGAQLKKALYLKEGFSLIEQLNCGWLDGGCWALASGLKSWIGDGVDLYCVYDFGGAPQHIVAKVDSEDMFIDGDGLSTRAELLKKMKEKEFLDGPATVSEFFPGNLRATGNGIERWDALSRKVAAFLKKEFGPGDHWLGSLYIALNGAEFGEQDTRLSSGDDFTL